MNFTIQVEAPFEPQVDTARLEQALIAVGRHAAMAAEASLSLVISDDEAIQQLNRQYLGIDAPTDVLSFPTETSFPGFDPTYLGDIMVSYPYAAAQAAQRGHAAMDEVVLLTVHGVLHLLNFDHDTHAAKETMWTVQAQIMADLGLAHITPTEM